MSADLPRQRLARVDVLVRRCLTECDGGVASSCSLIREKTGRT
jgi:hypothetical protein